MYIYIYTYVFMYTYTYIYIYLYCAYIMDQRRCWNYSDLEHHLQHDATIKKARQIVTS